MHPEQLARDFGLLKVVITDEAADVPMVFGPDIATLKRDNYFSKYGQPQVSFIQ